MSTPTSGPNAGKSKRINAIDILRGVMMCVIIGGHSLSATLDHESLGEHKGIIGFLLHLFFQFGTPGFILVSGTLLGYFSVMRPNMDAILLKYRDSGFKMLLTTHALVAMAQYYPLDGGKTHFGEFFLTRFYITDTIGLMFILVAPWMIRLRIYQRLWLGVVALIVCQLGYISLNFSDPYWQAVKEMLFGLDTSKPDNNVLTDTYAIIALSGMLMIGSFFGERYAQAVKNGSLAAYARALVIICVPLMALSTVLLGIWGGFKTGILGESDFMRDLLYANRAFSLFPAYLAMYLGTFAFWIWRSHLRQADNAVVDRVLTIFGKTSLFTYVMQYYVVTTLPYVLGIQKKLPFWGVWVLIGISVAILYQAGIIWNKVVTKK